MNIVAKSAGGATVEEAVANLKMQYRDFPLKQLVFFASYIFDAKRVAELVQSAFADAVTFGFSSRHELFNASFGEHSITALAFGPDALEQFAVVPAQEISKDSSCLDKARVCLEQQLGQKIADLDYKKYFGLTLFDNCSRGFEDLILKIGSWTDITFIGGGAGDAYDFHNTNLFCNGVSYVDAALLAVMKPKAAFSLLKTESVADTGKIFTVTEAVQADKRLISLDGRPAAEVYAEAIGVSLQDLDQSAYLNYFFGVMAEGEPYIRAIRRIFPDGSAELLSTIKEGMRVTLLQASDIISHTREELDKKRREIGKIDAVLDFDCILRINALKQENRLAEYGRLFAGLQAAGCSSCGEVYIGYMTQSATMVLFA